MPIRPYLRERPGAVPAFRASTVIEARLAALAAWEMTQDAQTLVVTLSGRHAPDALGLGDPGGSLDSPLLRHFVSAAAWEAPWHTVRALHQLVRRPEYAQAQLDFIREPQR